MLVSFSDTSFFWVDGEVHELITTMIASSVENCALCYVSCYFLFFLRPQFDGQRGKVETLFHGLTYLSPISVSLTYCISWFNTGCCICNIDAYITRCTECLMNVQFGVLVLFFIYFYLCVFLHATFPFCLWLLHFFRFQLFRGWLLHCLFSALVFWLCPFADPWLFVWHCHVIPCCLGPTFFSIFFIFYFYFFNPWMFSTCTWICDILTKKWRLAETLFVQSRLVA